MFSCHPLLSPPFSGPALRQLSLPQAVKAIAIALSGKAGRSFFVYLSSFFRGIPGAFPPRGARANKKRRVSKPTQREGTIPPYKLQIADTRNKTIKPPFTNEGEISYNISCGRGRLDRCVGGFSPVQACGCCNTRKPPHFLFISRL